MLSTENLATDILHGCFVVTCTLFAFVGLIWLREQILHGGGPDWLQRDNMVPVAEENAPVAVNNNVIVEEEVEVAEEDVNVGEANNIVEVGIK